MAHARGQEPRNDSLYVLVTGVNSGLGFAICCRLIDEFLQSRGQSAQLHLIFTTRDQKKSDETLRRLRKHLKNTLKKADAKRPGASKSLEPRIHFQPELVDLTSLPAVQRLAHKLVGSLPRLDRMILNAGIGGWSGVNWLQLAWKVSTDFTSALTWPSFKIGIVGWQARRQLQQKESTDGSGKKKGSDDSGEPEAEEEPVLGQVFCANVFGHYLLTHLLSGLLREAPDSGRVIWVSSVETTDTCLRLPDLQALESPEAYESSKRLTDLLVLTSRLPSTARWTSAFLSPPPDVPNGAPSSNSAAGPSPALDAGPKMFVAHPGITATSIMPLNVILSTLMVWAFYVARLVGSPWHTVDAYLGACSMVWLALMPQQTLDTLEQRDGPGKWGSAVDRRGQERAQRTHVDGWGFGGVVGDEKKFARSVEYAGARKGRRRGAQDLTPDSRAEFEQLGRSCWQEMETLRLDWEQRLGITADSTRKTATS